MTNREPPTVAGMLGRDGTERTDSVCSGRGAGAVTVRSKARRPFAAVILVTALVLWLFCRRSYFVADDFLNFRIAADSKLGLAYLRRPIFEHFAPGHRFANYVLQHLFPLNFHLALGFMVAGVAVCMWLLRSILDELFGHRPIHAALALMTGLSLPVIAVGQWWASSLHRVPAAVCALLCVHGYLRWYLRGRRSGLVLSVGAFAVGLLFFVKVLLTPVWIALVQWFFIGAGRRHSDARRSAGRFAWGAYGAVGGLYLLNYLAGGYGLHYRTPSLGLVARYLSIAWFRTFVPGLMGLRLTPGALNRSSVVVLIIGQLLIAAVVIASLAGRRAAWRGWLFVAVVLLVNLLLSGVPLLTTFGPGLGADLKYFFDGLWFVPIGIAFAVGGLAPLRRPAGRALGVAAVALYTVAFLGAANTLSRQWIGAVSRRYFSAFKVSLADVRRTDPNPVLVDGDVPEAVVGAWLAPYNRLSSVVPLFERVRFNDLRATYFVVGSDGRLAPGTFVPVAVWPAEHGHGLLEPRPGASLPPGRGCVTVSGGGTLDFAMPVEPPGPLQVAVSFKPPSSGTVRVLLDGGDAWQPQGEVQAMPGRWSLPLELKAADRLRLEVPPTAAACISAVGVGNFAPVAAAGR